MTKTFPWGQFDQVTFERGICIRRDKTGGWFYLNSESAMSVSDPNTVSSNFGVRPVLAEGSNRNAKVSFLLPATKGRLLEIYRSELDLLKPLKFVMGSMLYHCSALARLYAQACTRFVAPSMDETANEGNPSRDRKNRVALRSEAPFFEFETLITKIILGYESLKYPIWQKYQSGKETPRSFSDTIKTCRFPSAIEKRIASSNENCYLRAKKFRHCIQRHFDTGSSSWCRFEKKYQLLWLFMARLPDNPGEKSADALVFDQELDALTLAWECVTDFFALTDIIVGKGILSSA